VYATLKTPVKPHSFFKQSSLLDFSRVRRLIINADDFGLTPGVNRAILEAHLGGIVTSTTLMANGAAFPEAVQLARSVPQLSIGCHVVLLDGKPLLPAKDVSSCTSSASHGDMGLGDGLAGFAARALLGRLDPEQIEGEATSQIRRLQAAGIAVSHCDSHKHTHMFPAALQPLLRAAKNCGVKAIRNPFESSRLLPTSVLLARPGLWKRYAQVKVLRRFADQFRNAVSDSGLLTPNGTLGIVVTGDLDETLFRIVAESMPEGTWELVCHPGYDDCDLHATGTRLKESRATELRLLTSSEARHILAQQEIELISFRDLDAH